MNFLNEKLQTAYLYKCISNSCWPLPHSFYIIKYSQENTLTFNVNSGHPQELLNKNKNPSCNYFSMIINNDNSHNDNGKREIIMKGKNDLQNGNAQSRSSFKLKLYEFSYQFDCEC